MERERRIKKQGIGEREQGKGNREKGIGEREYGKRNKEERIKSQNNKKQIEYGAHLILNIPFFPFFEMF